MFISKKFILASNSSSRYRLLKNVGLNFVKKKPLCDEDSIKKKLIKKNINNNKIPKFLAKEKALSVSKTYANSLVVGSDTIIIFKDKIINKANNMFEAEKKLLKLSGEKHRIISGVSVCYKNKEIWSKQQSTTIILKKLNKKQIKEYLNNSGKEVLSSVGCYQLERFGPHIIQSVNGDFFNVLGFPLFPFLYFLSNV
tara:strand:- start:110 stop:700 length:591 start_codon:yes stop_codon:yes gene_type:complete